MKQLKLNVKIEESDFEGMFGKRITSTGGNYIVDESFVRHEY